MELDKLMELINQGKLANIRGELIAMNPADIAALFEEAASSDDALGLKLFRTLPKSIAAEVFSYLSIETQQDLIALLSDKEAAAIIDDLFADDAADILDELPSNVVKRILSHASAEVRADINALLKYPDDSAGSIMTVEFMDLKKANTVAQALEKIRRLGIEKETVDNCYVLSEHRRLLGTVSLRRLVISSPDAIIGDIMKDNPIFAETLEDQEEVARRFSKYDLTSMPVVDSENRLVGIITIDDIVDIMRAEATEDIEKMAAITPSDKPYLKTSVLKTYSQRIPWLLLLMVSATVTSSIIQSFESVLAASAFGVLLTSFVPMLTDTGGNSGSQASVTVIRGMSVGEIHFKDTLHVVMKELLVALLCGLSLALFNLGKMVLIDRLDIMLVSVVSITLFVTVIAAKLVGSLLPILAKRIGLDPAVMASPFITTIVDALALLMYFNIATAILGL